MKAKLMIKLALAAAVVCAAVVANADYFYWSFKDGDKIVGKSDNNSIYVFVSEVKSGCINNSGATGDSDYTASANATTYTVQSKDAVLSKVASILSGSATVADLGYLSTCGTVSASDAYTGVKSPISAIGAATFSAFAVVFDSATITKDTNYMILDDYTIYTSKKESTSYAAGTAIESQARSTRAAIVWGDGTSSWTSVSTINVPEPTSGVLLLVGIAALALRRKKAAQARNGKAGRHGIPLFPKSAPRARCA